MKKVILALAILVTGFISNAQFTGATVQATGLTCAMCSNAINKALQDVPFVASVKSDIPNSAFIISFKNGFEVDIDALKKAVEDAGFSLGKLQLTGNFSGENIAEGKHIRLGSHHFHFLDVKQQTLDGEKTITVVDRDFVTAKQFKKINAAHHKQCVSSGRAASCCTAEGFPANARVYHVTI